MVRESNSISSIHAWWIYFLIKSFFKRENCYWYAHTSLIRSTLENEKWATSNRLPKVPTNFWISKRVVIKSLTQNFWANKLFSKDILGNLLAERVLYSADKPDIDGGFWVNSTLCRGMPAAPICLKLPAVIIVRSTAWLQANKRLIGQDSAGSPCFSCFAVVDFAEIRTELKWMAHLMCIVDTDRQVCALSFLPPAKSFNFDIQFRCSIVLNRSNVFCFQNWYFLICLCGLIGDSLRAFCTTTVAHPSPSASPLGDR